MTTKKIEDFIRRFLDIREEYQQAKAAYEEVEEAIKNLLVREGCKSISVDGQTVTLVEAERRSFDAEALKELVSASVFRAVTEPTVKTKLLDSALALGKVGEDVIDKITTVTPYTQVRVK